MAQFKTLQFPNTANGQADKIRALEHHTSQGWRVVSETIIPGKFDTQKAACFWVCCGPLCALLAGHKEDTIQITLVLGDEPSNLKQVSSASTGTAASYDRSRWNALLQFDKEIFAASEEIRPLGQQWADELASSYMTLNDKSYLGTIVENIRNKAIAERDENARQAVLEEQRRQAAAAEWEVRRKADEAAKEQKRREREENAVFLMLSRNELIVVAAILLFLIGAAVALFILNKSAAVAPVTTPVQADSPVQNTPTTQVRVEPSFDCSKVQSAVLKLVCNSPDLANLDRQLASAYADALAKTASPETLRAEERNWIKERNSSAADADTIGQMYKSRIAALGDISAAPPPTAPAPNSSSTSDGANNGSVTPSPSVDSSPTQADAQTAQPAESAGPPRQSGHWYYCDASKAYYPAVRICSQPWRAVDPVPTTSTGGQH